jgi:hypothetical protein
METLTDGGSVTVLQALKVWATTSKSGLTRTGRMLLFDKAVRDDKMLCEQWAGITDTQAKTVSPNAASSA